MPKRLPEGEGKRIPLNMRTTRETRERLEQAAEKSGRSLAQEIEIRLERSFDFQNIIAQTISYTAEQATAQTRDLLDRYKALADLGEQHLIQLCGGDDLFLFWGYLAYAIKRVEEEHGKSIRNDKETREAAERAVLGEIPALFRRMPERYSEFKARAAAMPPDTGPLAELVQAMVEQKVGHNKKSA
ncbi:TraY domain-containing protein [Methylobacterium phyllosphaerae]